MWKLKICNIWIPNTHIYIYTYIYIMLQPTQLHHYHICFWKWRALSVLQYDADMCILLVIIVCITVNTLRPGPNRRHFADDTFKCIFLNENVWIPIEISLKFVPKGSINNSPALFQIMAWRRPGDKPLSEPIMVSSLTHICVTRPQWVNALLYHHWMQ